MASRSGLIPTQFRETGWGPAWLDRVIVAGVPTLVALGALMQRHGKTPLFPASVAALLAVAPFLLGGFGFEVPWAPAMAATDIGVLLLLRSAQPFDLAPFVLVAACTAAGMARPARSGLLCTASAMAVPAYLELTWDFTGSFTWAIGCFAGWAAGFGVQVLTDLVEQLTAAQQDLTQRAAAEERRRIAAELHDVIAHTLAVTMLHITGARLALETNDRREAIEALAEAERTGRTSLADVRRTVGLLADGAGGAVPALPDAGAVPALVDTFRSAGLDVEFVAVGPIASLPPAVGLALFRLAQESLTNASRHAPGSRVSVEICMKPRRIEFTARNVLPERPLRTADGGGHGVTGMAERACSLGGSFSAGPSGRDWLVRAEFPR